MGRGYTHIELHVPDFQVVKSFYGALGFDVVWEAAGPGHSGYLVMRHGDVVIRFWPGNESVNSHAYFGPISKGERRGVGVEIVLAVEDVDVMYERAQHLGAVVEDLKLKRWGVRDFRIADPFGYYLRIGEWHDVLDPAYGGRP